jgi:hypothetical protein
LKSHSYCKIRDCTFPSMLPPQLELRMLARTALGIPRSAENRVCFNGGD